MVTVSLTERCQHRFACHVLKRGSGISPLSKNTQPSNEPAAARSARAIAMA
jgi:hypothetical protein